MAIILDDAKLSARVTADVLQHADLAMTQRKYMRRGKVHHDDVAVIHDAVMGGMGPNAGRIPTRGDFSETFRNFSA
ncbi:hypothetical protein [Nocardia fluminea]|uniref:hypothetical protein n=1 Tax=Nocardia fluminea TaxID=134984 RepID=UPI003F4E44C0